jgi:hypothetical protein
MPVAFNFAVRPIPYFGEGDTAPAGDPAIAKARETVAWAERHYTGKTGHYESEVVSIVGRLLGWALALDDSDPRLYTVRRRHGDSAEGAGGSRLGALRAFLTAESRRLALTAESLLEHDDHEREAVDVRSTRLAVAFELAGGCWWKVKP